jgi:hypothetical protein
VGRKENRTSERGQVFGLHLQRKNHGQGSHERDGEEGKQGSGMCVGKRREKVGRRMMMFGKHDREYGAEIWGWKEQEEAERKQEKYLRGVLGVDRETSGYIVRCKRSRRESGKESDKVGRQNGWKGRVQDIHGMLERKEKKHGEGERGKGMSVKKWKD